MDTIVIAVDMTMVTDIHTDVVIIHIVIIRTVATDIPIKEMAVPVEYEHEFEEGEYDDDE